MKKTVIVILMALLPFCILSAAQAAPPEWKFDREHSSFFFEIKHIYYVTRGYFEAFSGTFRFDPDNLNLSKIDIVIETDSLTTHLKKRDRHVRSDDFMDVRRYPQMRFQSNAIRYLSDNVYEVDGRLSIKGVTKDITVPFKFLGVRDNPFNEKQIVAGFESRFTIDRLDYKVGSGKYYEMGVIGKDVDILITLEMLRDK
jgi:polyisoprenoid-binding protein YceI